MAEEVVALREFRDEKLLASPRGRLFVNTYYKVSPAMANFIAQHPMLRTLTRIALKPVVWFSGKFVE